jgi:hypothetical protein
VRLAPITTVTASGSWDADRINTELVRPSGFDILLFLYSFVLVTASVPFD